MALTDDVTRVVTTAIAPLGISLYDIEMVGSVLRVSVDRPGGIDIDTITEANRAVSRALDAADPIPGSYTLEVSSPGLERTLRTTEHLDGAVGERVKLKMLPGTGPVRRHQGVLRTVTEDTLTIEGDDGSTHQVERSQIERARTVFEWGPAPKPTGARTGGGPTKEAHT